MASATGRPKMLPTACWARPSESCIVPRPGWRSESQMLYPPFTSKTALVFDFSGSEITGSNGRASHLRKRGVPYCPYEKAYLGFQTRRLFSK